MHPEGAINAVPPTNMLHSRNKETMGWYPWEALTVLKQASDRLRADKMLFYLDLRPTCLKAVNAPGICMGGAGPPANNQGPFPVIPEGEPG
jgi:hypothetical protein